MPIWAIDLDGLEEMKANSVFHIIKDISGNIINKPTKIRASGDVSGMAGVRRIDDNFIEVTPGFSDKNSKTEYFNTFTWQQVSGSDFYLGQTNTGVGQDVMGKKPAKTNLVQDNEDTPPTTNKPTTVIEPISDVQVHNQTLTRNINFVSGEPQFATDADRNMVDEVAKNAPNSLTPGAPVTRIDGGSRTTTRTATRVRSIVTIDLRTDLEEHEYSKNLLNNRYNLLRKRLIDAGVPAGNVRRGRTQYNQPDESMGGNTNQTIFRVRTTKTRTTTGTKTTTE